MREGDGIKQHYILFLLINNTHELNVPSTFLPIKGYAKEGYKPNKGWWCYIVVEYI